MAKTDQAAKAPTKRQRARREKEERLQRLVTAIAAGLGAVILIIIVVGAAIEIRNANAAVVRIGESKLVAKDFRSRQRYERDLVQQQIYQYQYYLDQLSATSTVTESAETNSFTQQLQINVANMENQLSADQANVFGGQVLETMIEEELVRQEASARGISVTEDEIEQTVEQMIGYDRSAITETLTVTETENLMTEAEYRDYYDQFVTNILKPSKLSEKAFRRLVAAGLLRDKLVEAFSVDVETVKEQLETTIFLLPTEEEGKLAQERLNSGEVTAEALVEELSADEQETTYGVALGWNPVGYLGSAVNNDVEKAAFAATVGSATVPIYGGEDVYYVVFVSGHEERELSEDLLTDAWQQAYDTWLTEQKEAKVEYLEWEKAVVTPVE